jgi:cyclopropane fatty-acyl-phospholipid synthase-like methyltransferase
MSHEKPYAEACERNREPLLEVLREVFAGCKSVLEIGSGTGQHAVYFGAHLPHLTWQTGDVPANHPGIRAWLEEARLPNVLPPLALDVNSDDWPQRQYDAVFSANTLHIVGWREVELMFAGIARVLPRGGVLAIYGPFNYDDRYTADSNARFDEWLKARDAASGIRGFENVDALARSHGFRLARDFAMPANNRTLVWRRLSENAG